MRCRRAPNPKQVLPMLPVLAGIIGRKSTTCNMVVDPCLGSAGGPTWPWRLEEVPPHSCDFDQSESSEISPLNSTMHHSSTTAGLLPVLYLLCSRLSIYRVLLRGGFLPSHLIKWSQKNTGTALHLVVRCTPQIAKSSRSTGQKMMDQRCSPSLLLLVEHSVENRVANRRRVYTSHAVSHIDDMTRKL